MKGFWKYTLATIVGIVILSIISFLIAIAIGSSMISKSEKAATIGPNTVLYLNFDVPMYDKAPSDIQSLLSRTNIDESSAIGLNTILRNIDKAKNDNNIKGIFIETSTVSGGIAMADEIREALQNFKKADSSKFIVTYSKSLTQSGYYLATVSDMIFVNPEGNLPFQGLSAEIMFYKNLLDKLDIKVDVFRPEGCKYKSAVEPFIMNKMSEANKEQMQRFISNTWDYMLDGIAESRHLTKDQLNNIADNLLITNAKDAVKFGLIDKAAPYDEVVNYIKKITGTPDNNKLKLVTLSKYNTVKGTSQKEYSKDRIAIIYALGQIYDGKGNDTKIGDETLAKSIKEAREDKNVKAVVFRVNSPGGSALASEVILREIQLTKKVKPVIASFGTYAASGGYYISCQCNKIVCEKFSLTGSIGVFAMIPNAQKFINEKIGITTDQVGTNKNSRHVSPLDETTPDMKNYWIAQVNNIYKTFIGHVAEGRSMTTVAVDSIGQGRIWIGTDAKEIGLVDEIGGLEKAVDIAAQTANITNYRILTLPREKDIYTAISELLQNSNDNKDIKISQLGILYPYYKSLKYLSEMKGIQARMPYDIIIDY